MKKLIMLSGWLLVFCLIALSFVPDFSTDYKTKQLLFTVDAIKQTADSSALYDSEKYRPVIVASNDTAYTYAAFLQDSIYFFDQFRGNIINDQYTFRISARTGSSISITTNINASMPSQIK